MKTIYIKLIDQQLKNCNDLTLIYFIYSLLEKSI